MPRVVVGRIKLERAIHGRLDPGRGIHLIPGSHERQHFSIADRGRELCLGILRSEGRGAISELERNVSEPQLFFVRGRVGHQMPVLPRNTDEKVHVVRLELVRGHIVFECFFGLKPFVEFVAFRDQCSRVFSAAHAVKDSGIALDLFCPRRQAREAKHRT